MRYALLLLFASAAPLAAQGFTPRQIKGLIDPTNGAEAKSQYFYHYFKPEREQALEVPPWIDEILPGMLKRPV